MCSNSTVVKLMFVLLGASSLPAHALGVTDPTGDFIASYTGRQAGDLDVIGAFVTYDQSTDKFVFSGTMDAAVGTSTGAFYVWGVNRGAGSATFASLGETGVLFDAVVRLNQDGSGSANGTALPAGTAKLIGTTIIAEISGSLLPSTGFAKTAYTWNLWPRDGAVSGNAAISDFAPDNSNAPVTVLGAVPEPATWLLMALGAAALCLRQRIGRTRTT
jgi:hypothetical protein